MSTQDKLLPAVIPFPADISEEIKNGKQEEKLDVNIQTVAVPEEILSDPDMWMPQLLKKIEKAFAPNLGYDKNYHNKLHDWTEGCIALENKEMNFLWRNIEKGTPVFIRK